MGWLPLVFRGLAEIRVCRMTSPIVDLRNIDIAIWADDEGHAVCRISRRLPSGKLRLLSPDLEIECPKLVQALQIIGGTDRVLSGEKA